MRTAGLVLASVLLSGCIGRTPHLYPTNAAASQTGVLEAHMLGHGNLHGILDLSLPSGEPLIGEYSIVSDGSVGFGSVFSTVYGSSHGTAIGTGSAFSFPAGGQGAASLYGTNGTTLQCEFINNNMTGHGYGACQMSNGGIYRMMY